MCSPGDTNCPPPLLTSPSSRPWRSSVALIISLTDSRDLIFTDKPLISAVPVQKGFNSSTALLILSIDLDAITHFPPSSTMAKIFNIKIYKAN